MSRQKPEKDIFGRYYKAKFPHYASSVIIPSTFKQRRRAPTVGTRAKAVNVQQDSQNRNGNDDSGTSIRSSCVYDETHASATTEASKQVAQLIQEELPGCTFDPVLLEEIQLKCEMYLRILKENKIQLNEDVVMDELRLKLRNWAGLMHQIDLDDDEDGEEDTTTIKQPTRSVGSFRSSASEVDQQSMFFRNRAQQRHV